MKGWFPRSRLKKESIPEAMKQYGEEILESPGMKVSRNLPHHKTVTVYLHSVGVTYTSLRLASSLHLRVDEQALIRGALLHDYFLYDWHDREKWHRLHGFRHPRLAFQNAVRDFSLTPIEGDIIRKHMFPLTIRPPRCRESVLVCVADKICAVKELLDHKYLPADLMCAISGDEKSAAAG